MARRARHAKQSESPARRKSLKPTDRARVLAKTARRCHICGGEIAVRWEADHVLAYSHGGIHDLDNYLPAHSLCNNYRWDYSPEEFQWVLKIGVWARKQMEDGTALGAPLLSAFHTYELNRERRRRATGKHRHAEPVAAADALKDARS